jgi:hypothetical protein
MKTFFVDFARKLNNNDSSQNHHRKICRCINSTWRSDFDWKYRNILCLFFSFWLALSGICIGVFAIVFGLYVNNLSEQGKK